jgi:hypothetical protein
LSQVGIVEYMGKNLIEIDLSESKPEEALANIQKAMALVKAQARNSVLLLTNVRETVLNKDVVSAIKDFTLSNIPYVKASAVVGVDDSNQSTLTTIRFLTMHEIKKFETTRDAKSWLVKN